MDSSRELTQKVQLPAARGNRLPADNMIVPCGCHRSTAVGGFAGLSHLAHAHSVGRSCVDRLLRLTSLAPDIVEAILRGDEPNGISLEKLRKTLTVRWEEQRERWPNDMSYGI